MVKMSDQGRPMRPGNVFEKLAWLNRAFAGTCRGPRDGDQRREAPIRVRTWSGRRLFHSMLAVLGMLLFSQGGLFAGSLSFLPPSNEIVITVTDFTPAGSLLPCRLRNPRSTMRPA